MYYPLFLEEHVLMHWLLILVWFSEEYNATSSTIGVGTSLGG